MKKILVLSLCLVLSGCALPGYSRIDSIDCYYDTTDWYRPSLFGTYKSRSVTMDFKDNRIDDKTKYLNDLKDKVEEYLLHHPEITEETKSALMKFSVIEGMIKEQVRLLLGNPEIIQSLNTENKFRSDERWVYISKELTAVQIGPVPIFFTHDADHLYFRGDILIAIESVGMECL